MTKHLRRTTPASKTHHRNSPEQMEAIKAAIAEAEEISAEFAIEMYKEAKRLSTKLGE
jgi:hypothetical protein